MEVEWGETGTVFTRRVNLSVSFRGTLGFTVQKASPHFLPQLGWRRVIYCANWGGVGWGGAGGGHHLLPRLPTGPRQPRCPSLAGRLSYFSRFCFLASEILGIFSFLSFWILAFQKSPFTGLIRGLWEGVKVIHIFNPTPFDGEPVSFNM